MFLDILELRVENETNESLFNKSENTLSFLFSTLSSKMYKNMCKGESYIALFHISQFDCFLFAWDIRDLSMTPETCQAYNIVVWDVSARYTVCEL